VGIKMMDYLRYSGASIIFQLNPLHWKVLPWIRKESNAEWGSAEHTYSFSFLFLTIRIWIDNGDW
jgi:hypothetical protein